MSPEDGAVESLLVSFLISIDGEDQTHCRWYHLWAGGPIPGAVVLVSLRTKAE